MKFLLIGLDSGDGHLILLHFPQEVVFCLGLQHSVFPIYPSAEPAQDFRKSPGIKPKTQAPDSSFWGGVDPHIVCLFDSMQI